MFLFQHLSYFIMVRYLTTDFVLCLGCFPLHHCIIIEKRLGKLRFFWLTDSAISLHGAVPGVMYQLNMCAKSCESSSIQQLFSR